MPYMVFSVLVATEWQHIPDSSSLSLGLMSLPVKNDLLAITSA